MKIPFERTVAGAYRFAFANILSILGIGWFPVVLLGLIFAGLVYTLLPQLTARIRPGGLLYARTPYIVPLPEPCCEPDTPDDEC